MTSKTAAEFEQTIELSRSALAEIINGNTDGYKALYSTGEDITLGNPYGGFGRGWGEVSEQMERAASYYRDGETVGFEMVMQHVGTELAYTVEIERFRVKIGGSSESTDVALRVTCVYRHEDDAWKLVHRHADPRVSRQSAESVISDAT